MCIRDRLGFLVVTRIVRVDAPVLGRTVRTGSVQTRVAVLAGDDGVPRQTLDGRGSSTRVVALPEHVGCRELPVGRKGCDLTEVRAGRTRLDGVERDALRAVELRLPADGAVGRRVVARGRIVEICLLYTSDAADDLLCVDVGGRRIIKKKKN